MAIWITFLWWFIIYNDYFGNNLSPKSDAEIICDGISMLMLVIILKKDKAND